MCFTAPMHPRIGILTLAALCFLSPCGFGSALRKDKATISFHAEAQKSDNPKMIFPLTLEGKERVFSRTPDFSLKDMMAFRPFPSKTADDLFGAAIYLKPHAAKRLSMLSNANQGRWLAAKVNGRTVDAVLINSQVNDGTLVIWDNLSADDLRSMEKALKLAIPTSNPE